MMLLYKCWRESRSRFLITMAGLIWGCGVVLLLQKQLRSRAEQPMTYSHYVWSALYKGNSLRDLYILLVISLGLGGLLQERAHGTAGFTLALPVSRARLLVARAAIGLTELAALAITPAFCLAAGSPFVGESYPLTQGLSFAMLWIAAGFVLFTVAFCFSAVLAGEYSPWIVSVIATIAYSIVMNSAPWLNRYPQADLFNLMSGEKMPYFHAADFTLIGPMPWLALAIVTSVACAFIVLAARIAKRQDF